MSRYEYLEVFQRVPLYFEITRVDLFGREKCRIWSYALDPFRHGAVIGTCVYCACTIHIHPTDRLCRDAAPTVSVHCFLFSRFVNTCNVKGNGYTFSGGYSVKIVLVI